jgi:hypothetical protein
MNKVDFKIFDFPYGMVSVSGYETQKRKLCEFIEELGASLITITESRSSSSAFYTVFYRTDDDN